MKERGKRLLYHLLFLYLPLTTLAYVVTLYCLIRQAATTDDAAPADIIIVLGAAQYNGRPSPVFKARLDHSVNLFRMSFAPKIMTTGGHGLDARFTEAGVGKDYLVKRNIPHECIFMEPSGLTTLESIESVLQWLKVQNLTRVIAVSDGFHLFRIKRIFRDHGVITYGSPAKDSPIESRFRTRFWASLREVFVYTAYLAKHRLHSSVRAGNPPRMPGPSASFIAGDRMQIEVG